MAHFNSTARKELPAAAGKPGRLRSLDYFRGLTIAAMILVNHGGPAEETYAALRHAVWHGWTFADTIFPTFLWIVGVSLALSTAGRVERGASSERLLAHAVRRSLLLVAVGILVTNLSLPSRTFPFFTFGYDGRLQFTGVLQKIGVCYLAGFVIYWMGGWRGALAGVAGCNLLYLALLLLYPVPHCGPGVLTPECSFPVYFDGLWLSGHQWGSPLPDPDGFGALLPAVSTVLLGVLAGQLLLVSSTPRQRLFRLLVQGAALLAAGALLGLWIPVNKPIWTTSYAVLMAGISSCGLAASFWLFDMRGWGAWFRPFEIFGVNALAAYVLSQLGRNLPKIHVFGKSFYEDVCRALAGPPNASLLFAAAYVTAIFAAAWWMHRRRWFLKL